MRPSTSITGQPELMELAGRGSFPSARCMTVSPDVDGIYIGGGYPEIYRELENKSSHSLQRAHQRDIPIFGECGDAVPE